MADESARLFVAIYTDADIHGGLAAQIRLRGFDAISAYETGNAELSDPDQLAYAVSQRRAILTYNAKDFAPLSDSWWQTGQQHYVSSYPSSCRWVKCCAECSDCLIQSVRTHSKMVTATWPSSWAGLSFRSPRSLS